ncbi:RNA recognition motif domain-containing protein [Chitinophaga filiformis]|uniref:RNA recognition motif. (A.k.a. RRM, RBD, or RNP domain) n=1 Tax=Chitinophaga filiformis TaxID=104663 RepID=A0A1G7SD24_CHIFI|nr:RNA-binding protein [Chitinophaga filiformis]SDG20946.1 RNA recognition motif. (a.k.a. RRM, RBD, or RNP domain) [Chitinophaga filiformis]
MDIYVSNLSPYVVSEDLKNQFSKYGVVASASVIIDKFTNRSKGFGFVTMPNDAEAEKAIQEMNGASIDGKAVTANKARPREEKPARSYNNRW